jgi:hypothetical protein
MMNTYVWRGFQPEVLYDATLRNLQTLSETTQFRLCWRFPDEAVNIGNEAEPQWRRYWQHFLELDPELPSRDFPAWVLIDQPGLARWLAAERCLVGLDVPEDDRATAGLVQAKFSPLIDASLMDKRKLLQVSNPELFACYLRDFMPNKGG